jgi:hypothetical protein
MQRPVDTHQNMPELEHVIEALPSNIFVCCNGCMLLPLYGPTCVPCAIASLAAEIARAIGPSG